MFNYNKDGKDRSRLSGDIANFDASSIANQVNGFNITPCERKSETFLFLVFPNLGYGLTANVVTKVEDVIGTIEPGTGFTITRSDLVETEGSEHISVTTEGEELFVPLKGCTPNLFVATARLNSECAKSLAFETPIELPLPIRIIPLSHSPYIDTVKGMLPAGNKQVALFHMAWQVSDNAANGDPRALLEEALASETLRTAATLLQEDVGIGDPTWEWTGHFDADERLEYMHLFDDRGGYFDEIAKAQTECTIQNIFTGPCALLLIGDVGNRRLYYSEEFSRNVINSIEISGASAPPLLRFSTSVIVPQADGLPEWATPTDDFTVSAGAPGNVVDTLVGYDRTAAAFIDESTLANITNVLSYHQDGEGVRLVETGCVLATFRPPLFTTGEVVRTDGSLLVPFHRTYLFPYGNYSYPSAGSGFMNYQTIAKHLYFEKDTQPLIDEKTPKNYFHREGFSEVAYAIDVLGNIMREHEDALALIASEYITASGDLDDARGGRILLDSHPYALTDHATALSMPEAAAYLQGIAADGSLAVISDINDAIGGAINTGIPSAAATSIAGKMVLGNPAGRVVLNNVGRGVVATHPFVVKTTASALLPPESFSKEVADRGCVLDAGSADADDLTANGAAAFIDDTGYVDIDSLLAGTSDVPTDDTAGDVLTLVSAMRYAIAQLGELMENTAIHIGGGRIVRPDIIAREDIENVSGLALTIDPKGIVDRLSTVFAQGVSGEPADGYYARLQAGIAALEKAGKGENVPKLDAIARAMIEALLYYGALARGCTRDLITGDANGMFIYAWNDDTAEAVKLTISGEDMRRGLWFYNVRKAYLVWVSVISFIVACADRAVGRLASLCYNLSTRLTQPVVNDTVDLKLYSFLNTAGEPVYPYVDEEIGIAGLPSPQLNAITRVFPAGSLYYDMIVETGEVGDDTTATAVFLPGFGIDADHALAGEFSASDRKFWEAGAGGTSDLEDVYHEQLIITLGTDLNEAFEKLQSMIPDFGVRIGDDIGWVRTAGATPEKVTTDETAFIEQVFSNNQVAMPSLAAETIEGTIDSTKILAYTGKITTDISIKFSIDVPFKSDRPRFADIAWSYTSLDDAFSALKGAFNINEDTAYDRIQTAAFDLWSIVSDAKFSSRLSDGTITDLVVPFMGGTDPSLGETTQGESLLQLYTFLNMSTDEDDTFTAASEGTLVADILSELGYAEWYGEDNYEDDDEGWRTFTQGDPTFRENYNLFLAKRRAYYIAYLVLLELLDIAGDGAPIPGTDRWITITTQDVVAQGNAFIASDSTSCPVVGTVLTPFRAYGFGSLFADCAPGKSFVQQYAEHRTTALVFKEIRGTTKNQISYQKPFVHFAFPVNSTTGAVSISGNSPYLPQFDLNEDDERVWHSLITRGSIAAGDRLKDASVTTYLSGKSGIYDRWFGQTAELEQITSFDDNKARNQIEELVSTQIRKSDDAVFAYRGGILADAKVIIYTRS